MSIDRQRVAAVRTLQARGFVWRGGEQWEPPAGTDRADHLRSCCEAVMNLQSAFLTAGLQAGPSKIVLQYEDDLRRLESALRSSPGWAQGVACNSTETVLAGVQIIFNRWG
jgi:hypothetical protein